MIERPVAGKDYPKNLVQMRAWFPTDEACLEYLDWLRWPDGVKECPTCQSNKVSYVKAGAWRCNSCTRRISVLAGTMFERTRTPMTVWFEIIWQMTVKKNGISGNSLKDVLPVGSYQTIWSHLGKLRNAMSSMDKDKLNGEVEVDEWMQGGVRPGQIGRGVGKNIVIAAVEQKSGGRVRFRVVPDAKTATLQNFINDVVEPGSTIITDAWKPYVKATTGYIHKFHNEAQSPEPAHTLLPAVHKVFSLADRWLLGTHQGGVRKEHLQEYLDEYSFRYNRRTVKHRGMIFFRLLEHAIASDPITYREMVKIGAKKPVKPIPPIGRDVPGTLEVRQVIRPWLTT